jgi:hypothetical protein
MKKTIRLTESELTNVIKRIITESGIRDITKFLSSDEENDEENDDAGDADVFLQLCVMGDVVYG